MAISAQNSSLPGVKQARNREYAEIEQDSDLSGKLEEVAKSALSQKDNEIDGIETVLETGTCVTMLRDNGDSASALLYGKHSGIYFPVIRIQLNKCGFSKNIKNRENLPDQYKVPINNEAVEMDEGSILAMQKMKRY